MPAAKRHPVRLPTGPPRRREAEIQAAVIGCLRAYGILCWPQNREKGNWKRASHMGFKGLPDIGGVLRNGRALQVEVKRPGEKPDKWQLAAHAMLRAQNALVLVVCSVEDVRKELGL